MRRVSHRLRSVFPFLETGVLGILVLYLTPINAQAGVSPNFVYQGVFTDPGTGLAITNIVDLRLGIYDPSGTCLLYEEEHTGVNLGTSNGSFSLRLGSGAQTAASISRGYSMVQVFSNSQVTAACSYTPGLSDGRVLKVEIQNPTGSSYVALSPDQSIESVPTAIIAQTLQGYTPADFMQSSATSNVSNTNLAANAVDGTKIADGTVGSADLASNSVDSSKIADGTITSVDLAVNSVGAGNIIDGSIGLSKLDGNLCANGEILKKVGGAGGTWACATDASGGGGGLTSFTEVGTTPLTIAGTLTDPTLTIAQASGVSDGYLTAADFLVFNGKQGSALPSANIWVGNGGGTAAPVPATGDVSLTNTGAFTVQGLNGRTVYDSGAAPTDGYVLKWVAANNRWEAAADQTGGAGTGIQDINGLNAANQTLAAAVNGAITAPDISSAGSTHTVRIGLASTAASTGGLITNAQYTNFTAAHTAAVTNATSTNTANTYLVRRDAAGRYQAANPSVAQDVATKSYVDTELSNGLAGKVGTTLPSGQVFVGSAGNVATPQTITGDVSLTDAGVATVDAIQGRAVYDSGAAPTDGYILKWINANNRWEPAPDTVSGSSSITTTGTITGGALSTGGNLTFTGAGSNISNSSGNVQVNDNLDVTNNLTVAGGSITTTGNTTLTLSGAGTGTIALNDNTAVTGTLTATTIGGATVINTTGAITGGAITGTSVTSSGNVVLSNAAGTISNSAGTTVIFGDDITVNGNGTRGGQVFHNDADNSAAVGIRSVPVVNTSYNILLPADPGTVGQSLSVASVAGSDLTMQWGSGSANATQIQGRNVDSAAPTDGYVLKWVAGNNRWEAAADQTSGGGSGITDLNGLTPANQTLAAAVNGVITAPDISSAGSTHTVRIGLASTAASTGGLITNAQYTNFTAAHTAAVTNATSTNVANTYLVRRDAAGRYQAANPSVAQDVATKSYVDTEVAAVASGALGTALPNGQIFVGNGGVATATAVSGDATLSSAGDLQIASGAIVGGDLASNIAINTTGTIGSGAITAPSLTGTTTLALASTGANNLTLATNGTTRLTVTGAGAATFSGALTATGAASFGGSITMTTAGTISNSVASTPVIIGDADGLRITGTGSVNLLPPSSAGTSNFRFPASNAAGVMKSDGTGNLSTSAIVGSDLATNISINTTGAIQIGGVNVCLSDGTNCMAGTTYTALATGGLALSGSAFELKNSSALTINNAILKWDSTNDQFINTTLTETSGVLTSSGAVGMTAAANSAANLTSSGTGATTVAAGSGGLNLSAGTTTVTGSLAGSGAAGLTISSTAANQPINLIANGTGAVNISSSGTGSIALQENTAVTGTFSVSGTSALTGNVTVTGDVAVNGGDITSTAATLNVNPTTTLNLQTGGTTRLAASAAGAAVTGALSATTSLTSGVNGGTGGSLILNGATSGAVTLNVPSAITSYAFTLPSAAPGTPATMFLRGDGTWATPAGSAYTASATGGLNLAGSAFELKNNSAFGSNGLLSWDDTNNQFQATNITLSGGNFSSTGAINFSAGTNSSFSLSANGTGTGVINGASGLTINGPTTFSSTITGPVAGFTIADAGTGAAAINLSVTGTGGGITLGANGAGVVTVGGTTPTVTSAGALVAQAASGSASTFGNNGGASATTLRSGTGGTSITSTGTTAAAISLSVSGTNGGVTLAPNGTGVVTIGGTGPQITSAGALTVQAASGAATNLGSNGGAALTSLRAGTGGLTIVNNGNTFTWPTTAGSGTTYLRGDGTWATPSGGGTTTNAVTFNNGGAGAASGTTFDGSTARTISYNSIGAVGGTGTVNTVPRFTATNAIGDSGITDNGTTVTLGRNTAVTGYIRPSSFTIGTTNTGEAWIGRGSDRTLGSSTIQLGGASATNTHWEIVDRAWTKVIARISGEAPADSFMVNASGSVGIGVASAGWPLDVRYGSSSGVRFGAIPMMIGQSSNGYPILGYNTAFTTTGSTYNYMNSDTAYAIEMGGGNRIGFKIAATGTPGNAISFTEAMSISNNGGTAGNVGIGVTAPSAKLQVVGPGTGSGVTIHAAGGGDVLLASGGSVFFDGNYSYASGNYIRPTAANTQAFFTGGSERMRITSAGITVAASHSVTSPAYYHTSDARLKMDVVTLNEALNKVSRMRGVSFRWKENGEEEVGFIAQEVETVDPVLVTTGKDENRTKAVKYANITAYLVEAVKALKSIFETHAKDQAVKHETVLTKFAEQDRRISSIEAENKSIKERLDRIEKSASGRQSR